MTDTTNTCGEGAVTWADLEDEISDAIGDSMDMDWTYRDGAKAVIRALSEAYPNAALTDPRALTAGEAVAWCLHHPGRDRPNFSHTYATEEIAQGWAKHCGATVASLYASPQPARMPTREEVETNLVRIFNLGYSHRGAFNPQHEADVFLALFTPSAGVDPTSQVGEGWREIIDQISDLCTAHNGNIHDADDALGQINQLAYRARGMR